jgi:hypothetical protein
MLGDDSLGIFDPVRFIPSSNRQIDIIAEQAVFTFDLCRTLAGADIGDVR